MDHLGLVKTVDRFRESIIERVADTAHCGFDAGLRQALGVLNADVLGGFNRSSQHQGIGGCNDGSPTRFRSVHSKEARFARASAAWQRENRFRFWQAIALGHSSEEAALDAGTSTPLGPRWFRSAGGMPPTHLAPWAKPPSGRYLSFGSARILRLSLPRESASGPLLVTRSAAEHNLAGGQAQCRDAQRQSGLPASAAQWHADRESRRPPGKLAVNPALREYVEERLAGKVTNPNGASFGGPKVGMEKTTEPEVVGSLEPRADR